MILRKATKKDAEFIAPLILQAMEDIVFRFIGKEDRNEALNLLEYFMKRKDNQYSYQNIVVAKDEEKIIGAVIVYDGANLIRLRSPILTYIYQQYNIKMQVEEETQSGEMYIDSIGVSPERQGEGIGTKLIQFMIQKYVMDLELTLGLLVDIDNPKAKELYLKLGFNVIGEKTLLGHRLEHLALFK